MLCGAPASPPNSSSDENEDAGGVIAPKSRQTVQFDPEATEAAL